MDILKNQYSSSNNERTEIENMVANVPNMRTKKELKEFVLTEMIPDINSYIEERNSESEEELRSRNFEAYKEIYRKVMLLISVKGVLVLLTKEDTHYSGAASPIILIDKDRMKIEEIDENIKMGYAEVRLLSVYHTDLYKAYEKIAIKSRDMVAIAEAIKEVYEVVVGFSLILAT